METTVKLHTQEAENLIKNAIKALSDFTPAFKEIAKYQEGQIQEAFNVAGKNILGASWPKLKASTLKEKLKSGFQTQILVRTGKLRESFSVVELTKDNLKITSSGIKYFPTHQLGSNKVPQRQILGHSQAMGKRALEIAQDEIIKQIKK